MLSNGRITVLPRTSVANLLFIPSFQLGTSKVEVWHQGFNANSFSMVDAKHSDHPRLGKASQVVLINWG
jgi:hypothetical protein